MGFFHLLWVYLVFSEFLFSVHSDNQEVIYNIINITNNHRFPFLLSNLIYVHFRDILLADFLQIVLINPMLTHYLLYLPETSLLESQ